MTRARPAYLRPGSWAAVAAGGALGTLARHGTDGWLDGAATAVVNLAGAFLLGVLLEVGTRRTTGHRARELTLLAVGTGFLGGLTTYSTLALQVASGLGEEPLRAAGYALAMVVGGLGSAGLGVYLGTLVPRGRPGPHTHAHIPPGPGT